MSLSGCKLVSLSVVMGAMGLCGSAARAQASTVKVDGSSTVFPVAEAVAEEFQKAKKGAVMVTVGHAGTGGGFKKFVRGETDVSNASRPITRDEMKQCKEAGIDYIELPICFDALTVVVNAKNDWVTSITVDELKKIWEPAAKDQAHPVTQWNHIRPEWPAEKIVLFGPGADSGTFEYFTEAVCGKAKACRSDFTASEDDNVLVQGIEGNKYGLGYFGFAYYEPHKAKLKALAIEWPKNTVKTAVLPSMENVLKGVYNPLSRPLFIYVNRKSADKPEVKEYVDFFLKQGPALVAEVKYLPLPASAYEACQQRFAKREIGTAFGGVAEVGLKIEELMKRTPSTDIKEEKKAAEAASAPKEEKKAEPASAPKK